MSKWIPVLGTRRPDFLNVELWERAIEEAKMYLSKVMIASCIEELKKDAEFLIKQVSSQDEKRNYEVPIAFLRMALTQIECAQRTFKRELETKNG